MVRTPFFIGDRSLGCGKKEKENAMIKQTALKRWMDGNVNLHLPLSTITIACSPILQLKRNVTGTKACDGKVA